MALRVDDLLGHRRLGPVLIAPVRRVSCAAEALARHSAPKRRSPRSTEDAISKPGRNDPCHCGSGKKYKKCHRAEDDAARTAELTAKNAAAAAAAAEAAEADPEGAAAEEEAAKAAVKKKTADARAAKPPDAPMARRQRRRGIS